MWGIPFAPFLVWVHGVPENHIELHGEFYISLIEFWQVYVKYTSPMEICVIYTYS